MLGAIFSGTLVKQIGELGVPMALDPLTAGLNFGTALCNLLATPGGQGIIDDIRAVNKDLGVKLSGLLDQAHATATAAPAAK
jgi:hypothetical protein